MRAGADRVSIGTGISIALLLAVGIAGVGALLYFWRALLKPGDLGALSLPFVALAAGVAATFNPCGLPAVPGFFAFGGCAAIDTRRKARLCLAASLGAMSAVVLLGIPVALLGMQVKDLLSPHFRWVQIAIGAFLALVAIAHLAGQTTRLPLVGSLTQLGARIWERSLGVPTARAGYLFGAGFVAVGAT